MGTMCKVLSLESITIDGGMTRGKQGHHGLDCYIQGWGVEGLKHVMGCLFPVGLGAQGGLSRQHGMLIWSHMQIVVEDVVQGLLHVLPVGASAVLNRVLQDDNASMFWG